MRKLTARWGDNKDVIYKTNDWQTQIGVRLKNDRYGF